MQRGLKLLTQVRLVASEFYFDLILKKEYGLVKKNEGL
jgi:hypothetical protein